MNPGPKQALRGQGFTLGLLGVALLAVLFPEAGSPSGPLQPAVSTKLAVGLIFLLQGLSIPTGELLEGARKLHLHGLCLFFNYILAPAIMWALLLIFAAHLPANVSKGLLFLSFVPTTVSSAVVFTAYSSGNQSAALFAATLSNFAGVVLTPLLCLTLLQTGAAETSSLLPLASKLALLVLLPLLVGQALRKYVGLNPEPYARGLKRTANLLVLFIVFVALSKSVKADNWSDLGTTAVALLFLATLLFLAALSGAVWGLLQLLRLPVADRIALFFCGSQKTLAAGAPMATVIFAQLDPDAVGVIVLPLIVFHALQLLLAGLLSPTLLRQTKAMPVQ